MKIEQYNRPHQYNEGGETHDHLNDTEKACDKMQHTFIIKAVNEIGTEGNHLHIIKAICE